jgi:hypothetical protein
MGRPEMSVLREISHSIVGGEICTSGGMNLSRRAENGFSHQIPIIRFNNTLRKLLDTGFRSTHLIQGVVR